ncbi:hypothetical protein CBM2595_A30583 [Cupriavidus taiwanensis]|nr:hypothetical protein CBM2595_A30583 [Cupriavidus taiwanensis]
MEAARLIFKVSRRKIDLYRSGKAPMLPRPASLDAERVEAAWALRERCTMGGVPARELHDALAQIAGTLRPFPLQQLLTIVPAQD